jgi:hypothetical protein
VYNHQSRLPGSAGFAVLQPKQLTFAHGHIAHDGKPEHACTLDFAKEMAFIDETLKMADVGSKVLEPLA